MGDVLKKRARGARWRGMEVIVRSMVGVVSIQVLRRIDVVEQFVGTEDMRGGFFLAVLLGVVQCVLWEGERKSRLISRNREANTKVGYSAGGANRRSRVATGRCAVDLMNFKILNRCYAKTPAMK